MTRPAKRWYLCESPTEEAAEASQQLVTLTQVTPVKKVTTSPSKAEKASKPKPWEDPSTVEEPRPDFEAPSKKTTLSAEEVTWVCELFKTDIETQCSPEKLHMKKVLMTD